MTAHDHSNLPSQDGDDWLDEPAEKAGPGRTAIQDQAASKDRIRRELLQMILKNERSRTAPP